MKILYLSPTYFSDHSIIGGGERYAYELAKAMAEREEVLFLTFAKVSILEKEGPLKIQYLRRPFCPLFFKWFRWADVIHCHRVYNLGTDFAVLFGRMLGKRIFVII